MTNLIITDSDGRKRGLDPRELTAEQLEAAGARLARAREARAVQ